MDKPEHIFSIKNNLHFSLGECASSMILMVTSFCFLMYYSLEFPGQQALIPVSFSALFSVTIIFSRCCDILWTLCVPNFIRTRRSPHYWFYISIVCMSILGACHFYIYSTNTLIQIAWLFGVQVCFLFFFEIFRIQYLAIFSELSKEKNLALNLSIFMALMFIIGQVIVFSIPATAQIGAASMNFSERLLLKYVSIFACFIVLLFSFAPLILKPVKVVIQKFSSSTYRQNSSQRIFSAFNIMKKSSDLRFITLIITVANTSFLLYYFSIPLLINHIFHLPSTMVSILGAGTILFSAVQFPVIKRLSRFLSLEYILGLSFFVFACASLVTAFAGILPLPISLMILIIILMMSFSSAVLFIVPRAIYAELANEIEKKTGKNVSKEVFGLLEISFKVGAMIGTAAVPLFVWAGQFFDLDSHVYRLIPMIGVLLCGLALMVMRVRTINTDLGIFNKKW